MSRRKFSIFLIIAVSFFAGYFNYYLSPYFLNTNFALGVMSSAFTLTLMYCLYLKDKLKDRDKQLHETNYEVRDALNQILQKLNKKK